jgi:hypothetical protein
MIIPFAQAWFWDCNWTQINADYIDYFGEIIKNLRKSASRYLLSTFFLHEWDNHKIAAHLEPRQANGAVFSCIRNMKICRTQGGLSL